MKSVIIGAGTYGEVYLSYLLDAGVDIVGFVDDNPNLEGKIIRGYSVLGNVSSLLSLKESKGIEAVYCPIGNNEIRVRIMAEAKKMGLKTPCYIHPSAVISSHVEIGEGVYILLGTHIMPYTKIENYVMISMNVNVAHHNLLKEGVFLSTGVNYGASIVAHKKAYVGIGATIMTGISQIGENCLVGAGAVVIKDVPDNAIVAGVPAKIIKFKNSYND